MSGTHQTAAGTVAVLSASRTGRRAGRHRTVHEPYLCAWMPLIADSADSTDSTAPAADGAPSGALASHYAHPSRVYCSPGDDYQANTNHQHSTKPDSTAAVVEEPSLRRLTTESNPQNKTVGVDRVHGHSQIASSKSTASPLPSPSGFLDTFGYLGVAMVTAFTLSSVSMAFAAVVQLYPDNIGNMLLDTESLDNGGFLMFAPPSMGLAVVSAVALAAFASGYVALIALMFSFRHSFVAIAASKATRKQSLAHRTLVWIIARTRVMTFVHKAARVSAVSNGTERRKAIPALASLKHINSAREQLVSRVIFEFTSVDGIYHEYYVRYDFYSFSERLC